LFFVFLALLADTILRVKYNVNSRSACLVLLNNSRLRFALHEFGSGRILRRPPRSLATRFG
jgi:hypothetical protein